MHELETRLRDLAGEVEWPETPPLSAAVVARVERRGGAVPARGRRRGRRLAIAVALALLVPAAAALAFPDARDEVLDFLGVRGATVTRSTALPPAEPLRLEDLGRRVSAAEAERLAGFPPARPRALGPPDQIRFDEATDTVAHVYGDLVVAQTPGSLRRELVRKVVTTGTGVRAVEVEGQRGMYFDGAPHFVLYVRTDGEIAQSHGRLANDALVYTYGGTLVRIEAPRLTLARARAIARSMR
jgi:hypothetical protein